MFIRFDARFTLALIELVNLFKLGCNARSLRTTLRTFYLFDVMLVIITPNCSSGNHPKQCVNRSACIGRPSVAAIFLMKKLRHTALSKVTTLCWRACKNVGPSSNYSLHPDN